VRLLYHWIEAAYLYNHLDLKGTHHIHAHFVNGPTSIAMFLSEISGVPFSFTMHASMIWLDPIALYNKLRKCLFCASISEYNSRYIAEEYGTIFAPKIHIVHCGIDPEGFALPLSKISTDRPVRLLGVGQLNPRKGFHVLIEACRMLRDKGTAYVCKIVGDGDQRTELEAMVDEYNLRDLVSFAGAVKHEVIVELLEESDIFVLPCVIAKDGWRDGIPVALMEAMFNRRVVVSTRILGIPELIDDRINGRLVDPEDPMGLAIAIEELAGSPDTCSDLALKGREKVLEEFNNSKSALQLARLFDAAS
jgi:glycosyltransferase involved in cell wall biosynthesis